MADYWQYIIPAGFVLFILYTVRNMKKPSIENAMALISRKRYQEAEAMLKPLADSGSLKAMTLLGSMYFLNKEPEKGTLALEKAAAKGDLEANSVLAGVYFDGQYVTRDLGKARAYLLPVAESGNVRMQRQYGLWSVTDSDFDAAQHWLESAKRFGDKEAEKDLRHLSDLRSGRVPFVANPAALWDEEMLPLLDGDGTIRRTLEQMRSYEELIGEIEKKVVDACTDGKRPDYPTLFSSLGALAGYGCQIAIRDGLVAPKKISERQAFVTVDCTDGRKFYFGDLLNRPLLEYTVSAFALVKDGMLKAGTEQYPSIEDIARRVAQSISAKEYGPLSLPGREHPRKKPLENLKKLWPETYALIRERTNAEPPLLDPKEIGWVYGALLQRWIPKALEEGKYDPAKAGLIAMEAAISMAKVEPKWVTG